MIQQICQNILLQLRMQWFAGISIIMLSAQVTKQMAVHAFGRSDVSHTTWQQQALIVIYHF